MMRLVMNMALAAMFFQLATATDHTVGSPGGSWDLSTDLRTWAESNKFIAGDSLIFQYPAVHDVLEVSKTDFESCTTSSPLMTDASGNTIVSLKAAGKRYFICGIPGHCGIGMKIEIDINPADPPPPPKAFLSPTPPSSSTPSKPPSTPFKPPPSSSTPFKPSPTPFKPPPSSTPFKPPPTPFKRPPFTSTPFKPPPTPFKRPPFTSTPFKPPPTEFKPPPSFLPKPHHHSSHAPPPSSSPSESPSSSPMAPNSPSTALTPKIPPYASPAASPVGSPSLPAKSSSEKRSSFQPMLGVSIAMVLIATYGF